MERFRKKILRDIINQPSPNLVPRVLRLVGQRFGRQERLSGNGIFSTEMWVPVVVRMLSFIKTEVNVIREVGMLDESLDGNQKS